MIIHTGWGRLWGKENARYMTRSPGIGVAAGEWLVKQDPMLLGADNVPVEVAPPKDPQLSGPIHQMMLVVHGIHLLENLKLDELAAKKRPRVRVRHAAAQDPGRHGLDGRADRDTVTQARRSLIRLGTARRVAL